MSFHISAFNLLLTCRPIIGDVSVDKKGQGVADNMEERLEWFCNLFVLHK